jgi:hypothetical protein
LQGWVFVADGMAEVAVPDTVALEVLWLPTSTVFVSEEVELSEALPLDAVEIAVMDPVVGTVVVVVTDS